MDAPVPICLLDGYEGVRVALREALEARGAARVVAEARSAAEALAAPGEVIVAGLDMAEGSVAEVLGGDRPVVVYTWLPPGDRTVDLGAASAVVHLDIVEGLAAALRRLTASRLRRIGTPVGERTDHVRPFHLSLPVADLEAAAAFYADVLGCERRRAGGDWQDLDFHGHQLSLHEVEGYEPEAHRSIVDGVEVPTRHLGVVLDPEAWAALAERLTAQGVAFLLTPRSRFVGEDGEQHTFFLTDPSGNAIECKAFPGGVWT